MSRPDPTPHGAAHDSTTRQAAETPHAANGGPRLLAPCRSLWERCQRALVRAEQRIVTNYRVPPGGG